MGVIEIGQGDNVYLGEYVDITGVVSWQAQFAYWSVGYPMSDLPDAIIDASSFQHNYYIDPTKYRVGTYYKWDGKYERSGNMLAFYVKAGERPIITPTPTPTPQPTINPITDPYSIRPIPETDILLARGGELKYIYNNGKDSGGAWLWFFDHSTQYLGMIMFKNETIYTFPFVNAITQTMGPGNYKGYIQFAGANKKQDVFYSSGNTLDSIYKLVPKVDLFGKTREQYRTEFLRMAEDPLYSDDILVPINLTIEDPVLRITEYYEWGDNLIVEGKTSLSVDTNITCIVDDAHWVTAKEKADNTYPVIVTGGIDTERSFSVSMPLKWGELSIGEHLIELNVEDKGISLHTHKEFDITNTYVIPTPTPATVKVVVSEYGSHKVIPTATATPVPAVIFTSAPTLQPIQQTPTEVITKTIIQNTTNATPTKATTTPQYAYSVPVPALIGLPAIALAYLVMRRKNE
jgi:hypothetical protein